MTRRGIRIVTSVAVCISLMFVVQIGGLLSANAAPLPPKVINGFVVKDPLLTKFNAVGGVPATGNPLGNEIATAPRTGIEGVFQNFEKGSLFWSQPTGSHWVTNGPLLTTFFECAFFCYGMPTSDVLQRSMNRAVLQTQFGGNLYLNPPASVYNIYGQVLSKYNSFGGTVGFLGFPISSVRISSDGRAQFASFEWGAIVWSQTTGAHEVHGAIRARWNQLGSLASPLGLPISDELSVPGGRQSNFEHGSIFWNSTTGKLTVTVTP